MDGLSEIEKRDKLLRAGNSTSAVLLGSLDEENCEDAILEGMEIIGRCVNVDRVQIWRNETIDNTLYYVHIYQWLSDIGRDKAPKLGLKFPYTGVPGYKELFLQEVYINGPVSSLSQSEKRLITSEGIASVVIIPLVVNGYFWGFFCLDDCKEERTFSDDEVNILRSMGLMMINAINRNEQAAEIRKANDRTKVLLDAMPLAGRLWDREHKIFDINEESLKLFRVKDKQTFIDNYMSYSPEFQPDGQYSREKTHAILEKAFSDGKCVLEWLFRLPDGTLIPTENTLVRMNYGGEEVIAGYTRDLREYKNMMSEIERRDYLLSIVNRVAAILLQSGPGSFENDLLHCMGMLGEALDIDRINIWKNHTMEGRLFCSQIYGWSGGAEPQQDKDITVNIPYSENIPGWEETLSGGFCINSLVRDMSPAEQAQLSPQEILSIFVVPVFTHGHFWGFVGYDDCHSERLFTENEQSIMRSGGMVIANALLQNEMLLNIQSTAVQLEAALEEARAANSAKSEFLAKMSHEMRTPLNAVIGLSELSLENDGLSGETKSNLEKVYGAGTTLLSIVNDILDISKIEAGRLELVENEYDTSSMINDAVSQNVLRIEEKPILFTLDIDPNLPTRLYGDELRIKQIISNLLSNAFKYTKKGTVELRIKCTREGGAMWIILYVKDTGIGIREADLNSLFVEYSKLDLKQNRMIEGTGLGLPITQRLAEMMGGSVSVESEYGKGSTFSVKLKQKLITTAVIGRETAKSLANFSYSDSKRDLNVKQRRISLPYARVLVVDDIATNLDVVKGMMKPYGMQIDCLTSGQQAIDAIREEKVKYNAIFMDHMMPEMDGITATKAIREMIGTEYAKTVPVIALTANAILGNEKMFLENGFQAFLPKPIDIARLDTVIREWVRDRELEKELTDQHVRVGEHMLLNVRSGKDRRSESDRRSKVDRRTHIVGLHMKEGLKRFGGDEEAYMQVLRSYATNTKPLLEAVVGVSPENLPDYAIIVHGIKGSSYGICANLVGEKAEALEKAAKECDFDFINANNPAFYKTLDRLIIHLEDMLSKREAESLKPVKEKPDRDLTSRLLVACEQYDMDGIDSIMLEIEAFNYSSDNGLSVWLRENIEQMNLTHIIKRLSAIYD